jgi:hypothetical protein
MRSLRSVVAATAVAASIMLTGCNPGGLNSAIGIGPDPENGGWTGLPIGELLTRQTLETKLLAACFSANCSEPAALMMVTARGQDAADLRRTLRNPNSLVGELASARRGPPSAKLPKVETRIDSAKSGAFQRITIRMSRPDKPDVAVHGVIVARDNGSSVAAVIAIAEREDVAEANAASAAQELL